jgi:hypothetical protein
MHKNTVCYGALRNDSFLCGVQQQDKILFASGKLIMKQHPEIVCFLSLDGLFHKSHHFLFE